MKLNLSSVTNAISRKAGVSLLKVKKVSPEIGMVIGTVAIVGGVIGACKASTKLEEKLAPHKEKMDEIREAAENPENFGIEDYTEKEIRRDLTIMYAREVSEVVKLYAFPTLSILLGLGCFYGSHHVLTKRNAALAAAYASVDNSFKQYRKRVIERFGKDMDRELRFDIKSKAFEETVVDAKGKEKTVTKNVEVVSDDLSSYSEFARFFDEGCSQWEKDAEYNLTFLRGMQARANDLLITRGYLFLNEVYDMLGIKRTKAGQAVGWTYNAKTGKSLSVDENGDVVGDGYVDFGIYESRRERTRAFVNGYEPVILLDFNVEGSILDLLDTIEHI